MPTLIQKATAQAIGTSVSAALGSNITIGNAVIATLTWSNPSDTMDLFNSVNNVDVSPTPAGTGIAASLVSYTGGLTFNAQPGTFTFQGSTSQLLSICLMEWSGLKDATAFNDTSGSSTSPSSGMFTGTGASNLYLGACGVAATGLTITDEAGWTNVCSLTNESLGAVNDTQYLIAGPQTLAATWGLGSVSHQWAALGEVWPAPVSQNQLLILQAVKRASSF